MNKIQDASEILGFRTLSIRLESRGSNSDYSKTIDKKFNDLLSNGLGFGIFTKNEFQVDVHLTHQLGIHFHTLEGLQMNNENNQFSISKQMITINKQ